jgi:hypothetical protein
MFERFVLRIQNKQRMNMAIEILSNFDSHSISFEGELTGFSREPL